MTLEVTTNNPTMRSLSRGLNALLEVAEYGDVGCTLTEVSRSLGLHRSTTHRLLEALTQHGLVSREAHGGRYVLGLNALRIGSSARRYYQSEGLVRRELVKLRDACEETANCARPIKYEMVYIDRVESRHTVRIASEVGDRLDMYSTALGKAYLASRPHSEVLEYIKHCRFAPKTDATITDGSGLLEAIEQVRKQGFALDDCENETGIRCVGSAVIGEEGIAVGAVSVAAPTSRLSRSNAAELAATVMETAAELSAPASSRPQEKMR